MKILITGGSGTLGGYVLRELLHGGHELSCYSRTAPRVDGVCFIEGDIEDIEQLKTACRSHHALIHMAAVPGPGRASPERLIEVNVSGTINVLEAAIGARVGTVVLASSGAATGFSFQTRELEPGYLPLDEEHPCKPQDSYGLSKLLAEQACRGYSDGHGIRTICLRINHNWYLDRKGAEVAVLSGWAHGLTVEELWTKRYRKVLEEPEGDWPSPGPPAPHKLLWAFTDARDAARSFRLAVENTEIRHEVFLINGADTCSREGTRSLIERYHPNVPLRAPLPEFASLWSHHKATRMLGYEPRHTWRKSDFRVWLERRQQKKAPTHDA